MVFHQPHRRGVTIDAIILRWGSTCYCFSAYDLDCRYSDDVWLCFGISDVRVVRRDGLDGGKVAIGDAKRPVGCGELDAVVHEKLAIDHAVHAEAGQAAEPLWGNLPRDSRR
jgi:hypothetical protein